MQPWDLEKTGLLIGARFGQAQSELLHPCLQSIADRKIFASYHFMEQRRLLKEKIDDRLAGRHVLQVILPLNGENEQVMRELTKLVAANVVACLQSLHCLGDTLSHAVYYACGLNLADSPISESNIDLPRVERALSEIPEYSEIRSILSEIVLASEFIYLSALVNHSKHRSIIAAKLHVDATGTATAPYSLRFPEFKHKGVTYPARDVESFLEPCYSFLSIQIVKIGHALNAHLERGIN